MNLTVKLARKSVIIVKLISKISFPSGKTNPSARRERKVADLV
jgi:hypothetical protein